jgi:hypothetical protein
MMRFLRRMILLLSFLFTTCTSVVLVPRLNRAPNRLEVLGFGMCSGDHCWQGIRPGLDWTTARNTFPDGIEGDYTEGQSYLMVDMGVRSGRFATIYSDGTTVERINFRGRWEPVRLREIILHYGSPRCIEVGRITDVRLIEVAIIYPTLRVSSQIPVIYDRGAERHFFTIAPNVRLMEMQLTREADTRCRVTESRFVFPWHGFQAKSIGRQ